MLRTMLKSKIHRAIVTDAQLHYEGSVTIDVSLMKRAGLIEHEQVHIYNVTTGTRLITYAIPGPPDSGEICINGAAAHLVSLGDKVIIMAFTWLEDPAGKAFTPSLVFVDEKNRIKR